MSLRMQSIAGLICLAIPTVAVAAVYDLKTPMNCAGGEPFWGLTINDTKSATYIWDNQPTPWKVRSIGHAAGRLTTWHVVFEGTNREAFIFDEGQQSCSDSDSDEPAAYGILLQNGEGLLRGCCNPKE
jgi:uncharacterized membrane protein